MTNTLWLPQERGIRETQQCLLSGFDTCLYAPTGGGKTRMAVELFKWAESLGWTGCFYLNRRLLVPQTAERFDSEGLKYGIRAAGFESHWRPNLNWQICSAQTEWSRVYRTGRWNLHESNLIVIDEAHLQKRDVMQKIIFDHKLRGALVVLMTATPIGLSHLSKKLVISGTLQEFRDCGALVPAQVRSIEQPDMRKVKRNKTGEFILDGKRRSVYTQSIVGNVVERYERYNPDRLPTLLYAPGVEESRYFCDVFSSRGHRWCHVDAVEFILDGKRSNLTNEAWRDIKEQVVDGRIHGLSCRFKLREGIDIPEIYHCILATPIGSLASYIQTVGRVLRRSDLTPDHVTISDHGGNYLRHGSPNVDRPWKEWWDLPEHVVSQWHVKQIAERAIPEPIVCPRCELERRRGSSCPFCGFEHERSRRHVIMASGELRTVDGPTIKPRTVRLHQDTQGKWNKLFWGARKHGKRTFEQVYAWFFYRYHYYPPRTLDYMPMYRSLWSRRVSDLETDKIKWPPKKD